MLAHVPQRPSNQPIDHISILMNALIKFRIDFMIAFFGSLAKNASVSTVQIPRRKKNIFYAYFCAVHSWTKWGHFILEIERKSKKCHEKSMHSQTQPSRFDIGLSHPSDFDKYINTFKQLLAQHFCFVFFVQEFYETFLMFYLSLSTKILSFGIFQQQQTDVVKFSRLIEFLMWYLVHTHILSDEDRERKRKIREQLIHTSHSHRFIVRHFIFCVFIVFISTMPSFISFYFVSFLDHFISHWEQC